MLNLAVVSHSLRTIRKILSKIAPTLYKTRHDLSTVYATIWYSFSTPMLMLNPRDRGNKFKSTVDVSMNPANKRLS